MLTPVITLTPSRGSVTNADPMVMRAIEKALALPTRDGNGMTTLLDGVSFPAPVTRRVIEAIRRFGLTPVINYLYDGPRFTPAWFEQNAETVNKWGLRGKYQREAIEALLCRTGGVLEMAAGGGKTVIAALAVETIVREWSRLHRPRILWVAQTIDQVRQAKVALGLLPKDQQPGRYYPDIAGRASIEVCCWQGVDSTKLDNVDIFVGDEVHSSIDSLYEISQVCTSAWWRIGLTATYVRGDRRELLIEAAFGPKCIEIPQAKVLDEGHLVKGRVEFLCVGRPGDLVSSIDAASRDEIEASDKRLRGYAARNLAKIGGVLDGNQDAAAVINSKTAEQIEVGRRRIEFRHAFDQGIAKNTQRNQMVATIAQQAIAAGESVLVLIKTKEQGRILLELIPGSKLVFSSMSAKEGKREKIIAELTEGKIKCLIATSLADQGLDVPCVGTVIMAMGGKGGKNGYLIEQRSARAQRTHGVKEFGNVIEFYDAGHPMLVNQSWLRYKAYKRLGFEIRMCAEMKRGTRQAKTEQHKQQLEMAV